MSLPRRQDRDDFILESLKKNPYWENIQDLRKRLIEEGWHEYPNDPTRARLSTYALKISLSRLRRQKLMPKVPHHGAFPRSVAGEFVAEELAKKAVAYAQAHHTQDVPAWAKDDAQRIKALVLLGLRVRLTPNGWEVVP